jgi:hypothetical protein
MTPGRSIGDLFGDLLSQFQQLIRNEYLIARAEIGDNLGRMRGGAVMLIAGAVVLLPALTVALFGVAMLLTRLGMAQDIAALLVGAIVCLVGVMVMVTGIKRVKSVDLIPEKTLDQLQRDVAAVKHARHSHEHAAA